MATRRPASSPAGAGGRAPLMMASTLAILVADPQLQGEAGAGAWRLTTEMLDQLLGSLSLLDKTLDAPFEDVGQEREEQKPTGNPFWPLGWSPAQGDGVLQLAALVVRWPGYESWLPLTQLLGSSPSGSGSGAAPAPAAPGAMAGSSLASGSTRSGGKSAATNLESAAVTRQALVARLRRVGLNTLQLVDQLLWTAPLELSCRLACALLRMHTLHACSRSLAQAVSRLPQVQAAQCPAPDADADPQAAADAGVAVVGGDAAQADAVDRAAVRAWAAPPAPKSDLAELHDIVKLSYTALEGICAVISRLPQIQNADTEDDVEQGAGRGSHQTGIGSGSSSSSAAGAGGSGSGGLRSSAARRSWSTELVALLREALPGSGLVEHLARGVLHLLHSYDGSMSDIPSSYIAFSRLYMNLGIVLERSRELRAVGVAAMGGPCASYLATAGGLQLLCIADGGQPYGMCCFTPHESLVACWHNRPAHSGGGLVDRPVVGVVPFVAMAYALLFGHAGRPAAVDLYVRLGNLAVAAGQHFHAALSGEGSAASSGGGSSARQLLPAPELLLHVQEAGHLATLVLRLMDLQVGALPARRRLAAGRRRWQLACGVVQGAMHWAKEKAVEGFAGVLATGLRELPADGTLPPQPPPALAAALSGGLLPCLERIVRRAGQAAHRQGRTRTVPCSTEQQLLQVYATGNGRVGDWGWLLAYGSPAEAAGLVVSWGKLLRAVAAEALPGEDGTLPSEMELPLMALVSTTGTLGCLSTWAMENQECVAGAAAPAAAGDGGPVWQLRQMAALAACEWLPAMSGYMLEAARRLLAPGPQHKAMWSALRLRPTVLCVALTFLDILLKWVPVDGGAAPQAEGAGPSGQPAAGAQGAAAAAAEGPCMLQRLAREVRLVEMVGAGMRLVACCTASGAPVGGYLCLAVNQGLRNAACGLAMHSPGEVRRALAARPAAGVLAHCMWSSEVVGMVARGMGEEREYAELKAVLASWEKGEAAEMGVPPAGKAGSQMVKGRGLLVTLRAEAEQPCPLQRCSWWRCTHLAGDSEAGVERSKCGGCSGKWYCGRECQVAHWRAGHKAECGSKG